MYLIIYPKEVDMSAKTLELLLDSIITNTAMQYSTTNEIMLKLIELGAELHHTNGTTYDINANGIRVTYDDCSKKWFISCECKSAKYFSEGGNIRGDRNQQLREKWASKLECVLNALENEVADLDRRLQECILKLDNLVNEDMF